MNAPETASRAAGAAPPPPASTSGPARFQAGVLLAVALGWIFLVVRWAPLDPFPIWGDLCLGRWIAEHRALPQGEPFSPFAARDAPFPPFSWLAQVLFYGTFHAGEWLAGGGGLAALAGGVEALRLAHAALAVALAGVLAVAYRSWAGSGPWLAVAGLALLFSFQAPLLFPLGPRLFGLLCFAALLALLRPGPPTRLALVGVPLVVALWANLDDGWLVGLLLLFAVVAGRFLDAGADAGSFRLLLLAVGTPLAVGLLNPAGFSLYPATLTLGSHPNTRTLPAWQPFAFTTTPGPGWSYLASLGVVLLSQAVSPRPAGRATVLLLLVFGFWPPLQPRMLAWWLLLVPCLVLPLWAETPLPRLPGWLPGWSPRRRLVLAGAAAFAVVLLALSGPGWWLLRGRPRDPATALAPATPWRLVELLRTGEAEDGRLDGVGRTLRAGYPHGAFAGRIFASVDLADFLLWGLPPETPVLLSGRPTLFPVPHWQQCIQVQQAGPGWWEILDRNRVNLVVVDPHTSAPLAELLAQDPRWVVTRDGVCVALRKQPYLPPIPSR